MGKFINFSLKILCVLGVLAVPFSARADDASTLLNAPKLPPYQWFASTDPKHHNADYVVLKPGETRRIPLAKGVLLRLWSTALEPDKIELALQNGTRIELLKNGKTKFGNYYQKAFTFYPRASTPAAARDLKDGAALIVTNDSQKENKWFYQVSIRPRASTPVAPPGAASVISKEEKIDWNNLGVLKTPTLEGKKIFSAAKNGYQLCIAQGSAHSQKGKPIPILKVDGEGAFVGLVLDIRPAPDAHRRTFALLEGNETLIADGKKFEGTGTEDFFNSAWYFPDKPFSQEYSGLAQKTLSPPSVTAYRWMIPDAVPFKKHLEFQFEHGNGNNDNDMEYRWVAFWYQKPDGKFEIEDALKGGGSTPAATENSSSGNSQTPSLIPIFAALAGAALVGGFVLQRRARR